MELQNGKRLRLIPSQRDVEIPYKDYFMEETVNSTGISSIKFDNDLTLSVGDKIPIKFKVNYETTYTINNISKNKYNYILEEFSWNEGNYFLLPLIFNTLKIKGIDVVNALFINCYNNITHKDWIDKKKIIYVAYRFSPCEYFEAIETSIINLPNYIDKIDDGNVRLYALKIHNNHLDDYNNLINHNYELSDKFVKKVCKLSNQSEGILKHKLKAFEIESCIGTREAIAIEYGVSLEDVPKNVDINQAIKYNKNKLVWKMR